MAVFTPVKNVGDVQIFRFDLRWHMSYVQDSRSACGCVCKTMHAFLDSNGRKHCIHSYNEAITSVCNVCGWFTMFLQTRARARAHARAHTRYCYSLYLMCCGATSRIRAFVCLKFKRIYVHYVAFCPIVIVAVCRPRPIHTF